AGEFEDQRDPTEGVAGPGEGGLRDPVAAEEVADASEFTEHELEPQLVDLMDGDEPQLRVLEFAVVAAETGLECEQLFDLDVVPVGRRGPMGRAPGCSHAVDHPMGAMEVKAFARAGRRRGLTPRRAGRHPSASRFPTTPPPTTGLHDADPFLSSSRRPDCRP